ncbi:MAG: molybdate ABC transporter substrate-binding protein [Micromonosporaceae bacterium]|nr:molybdate ABC transporter substrate-binding protein [Micromonosporaceae bacterium]
MVFGPVRRRLAAAVATAAVAAALTGCSSPATPEPSGSTAVGGTITVFAAASLTDVFEDIAEDFEAAHPGARLEFNFAGSSALATQINEGAPADVFASASPATMKTVADAGNTDGEPVVFVRNQLVIAVEAGNPKGITGLADLTKPGITVALCAEQVPCGAAAKTAIEASGLTITPVSYEENVRAALSKVSLGEVDAALVYRTDAAVGDAVEAVDFPESAKAINDYLIAVLKDAPNKAAAEAFVAWVLSADGTAVLTRYGFQLP